MSTGMAHMLKSMLGVDPELVMKHVQEGAADLHAFADTVIKKIDTCVDHLKSSENTAVINANYLHERIDVIVELLCQNYTLSQQILSIIDPGAAGEITTTVDPDLHRTVVLPIILSELLARDDTFAAQK